MPGKEPLIALVTGANRGIGFEVCRQLAQRGFSVILSARDADKARTSAEKLGGAGHVEPLVLDVADPRTIIKAAAEVAERHGCLDVLVNNAGTNYDTWESAANADIEGTVVDTITTNLLGPWRVCKAFLPLLRKSRSKDVVSLLGQHIPYVITVCDNAKERCPVFPRTYKFLHWSFEDPAAAKGSQE